MGLRALKHPDSLRPDALQTIFGTDRRENYPMNFQEQSDREVLRAAVEGMEEN
jgi:hypothetical protein